MAKTTVTSTLGVAKRAVTAREIARSLFTTAPRKQSLDPEDEDQHPGGDDGYFDVDYVRGGADIARAYTAFKQR